MELHHNHKLALQRNQKSHRKRLQVIDSYEGCSRRGVKNRCLVSNSGALFQLKREDSIAELPDTRHTEVVYEGMQEGVHRLTQAGKKVILVADNPSLPDPKKCIGRVTGIKMIDTALDLKIRKGCNVPMSTFEKHRRPYLSVLDRIKHNK